MKLMYLSEDVNLCGLFSTIVWLLVPFSLLVTVLFVLFQLIGSDYLFEIFKLFVKTLFVDYE